jgi:hypothetical protein
MSSTVQLSTNWRIGEEPMNRQASIGTPVSWVIRTIGSASCTIVRPAQLAAIDSP